ncbi:damage-inducible protein CinA [Megasphaera cerevisiae DSM 20462]|jgi:nicotinamide-nucleotide amidase|uniref:Putative competence-damage inducible protein n=1 Tax=Megasphaera cerevisiae DSM 20462 TaxID=1122219 RepID=A0A0J6WWW6_9FIRM|nr:competence/damage-inducible protein A [Megasphaera cerevisiae]KMO86713.1 damage-inducible protein CinA [Megasphaera cerevisiae DSM 20462]OKY53310.1 competence/damage-inducible protein A [Megasphaera cerevisiae]SJZ85909.1 nicotinamide-nucleotide amidase [Megasphaera cerevisiae DSM 20462]
MLVEIVTTGSELLLGEIVNENSRYLSQELNTLGYSVVYHTTVGDNPDRMEQVLRTALARADMVITTGGLGPTQGDMTKLIGAKVMGLPMEYHPEISAAIRQWVHEHHPERDMTANQERQAMIPAGAAFFSNEAGTAPGVAMQHGGKMLVHLPGPPREMRWMYEQRLKPYLLRTFGSQGYIKSVYVKIYDMGEAFIEEKLMDLVQHQSNPTLAMYARPGFVEVRITARAATEAAAAVLLLPLEKELRQRLHRTAVAYDQETMADVLGRELLKRGYTISAAESCTGGLVGSLITDVPGASAYFRGSAGTYCDEMKQHILGVATETLRTYSAVSPQTAGEMAQGSRRLYRADIAVSTTGLAGPDGGTAEQPVGLVYTGIDGPWGTIVRKDIYPGDRTEIKRRAAARALYYVVQYLLENTK